MPTVSLILYGKDDCSLCDRLESMLKRHIASVRDRVDIQITKRDIFDDPQWAAWYRYRIPVLSHEGKAILEGRPTEADVAAAIGALVDRATRGTLED